MWARRELSRFRRECTGNCGVAASAFVRRLFKDWDNHPALILKKVNEFVDAVNGFELTDVKHHVAKNFGIIYAGACLAIEKGVLPWNPGDLLESIRKCFIDAMGGITTSADILIAGKAMLRDALRDSSKWPPTSRCSDNSTGFVRPIGERRQFVADIHAFRALFDSENQARVVLKWLHEEELLKVSRSENESLDAAIWKGSTPKWPDGAVHRSYQFFSPFKTTLENKSKQNGNIRKYR